MKARSLLKKLTDHGLTVKQVDDKIRLSPVMLINEKVISFVRNHKEALISALNDEHREKKRKLGHRIGTLQVCLRRYYEAQGQWKDDALHWQALNQWLDQILVCWKYNLEEAIDHYGSLTPEPAYTCKCGLRAPFCSCSDVRGARPVSRALNGGIFSSMIA